MPEKEQQDRSLSEIVVKEAVGMGMDTPMRESIVEAVDEAEGRPSAARRLPIVGAALGIGAGIGYLLGLQRAESLELNAESIPIDESEVIEDVTETAEEAVSDVAEDVGEADGGDGRRLPRIALVLAIGAGIAVARRWLKGEEAEEWEPIEEFDTGAVDTADEESEDETETTDESADEETADEGEEAET